MEDLQEKKLQIAKIAYILDMLEESERQKEFYENELESILLEPKATRNMFKNESEYQLKIAEQSRLSTSYTLNYYIELNKL